MVFATKEKTYKGLIVNFVDSFGEATFLSANRNDWPVSLCRSTPVMWCRFDALVLVSSSHVYPRHFSMSITYFLLRCFHLKYHSQKIVCVCVFLLYKQKLSVKKSICLVYIIYMYVYNKECKIM